MRSLKTLVLGLLLASAAWAQRVPKDFDPVQDVAVRFEKGAVAVTVPRGVHLKKAFMALALKDAKGTLKRGPLPKGDGKDELGDEVWHGTVRIPVTVEGARGPVEVQVTYQPCVEGEGGTCFPPTTQSVEVPVQKAPAPSADAPLQPEAPSAPSVPPVQAPAQQTVQPHVPPPASRAFLWLLLAAFGWGLAASLTPCVYPMIPITMAIVGAKGSGKAKGFALSLSLVLGMAVTYTALGVLAALSGAAFGAFAQTPWFLVPVSLLFATFALSLFGAFEIALPAGLQNRLQGGPRKGFAGAFLMGLVLGPLAAPCVGPFVGTVLVGIAQQHDVVRGALQLFAFSLGMGVLFMAVGTFSAGLPRSGDWLIRFKQIMGLLVLGFAAWNVRLLVSAWANHLMWTAVLLAGSAVFGAFSAVEGFGAQLRRAFAVLLLALGLLTGIRAVEGALNVELLPRSGGATGTASPAQTWLDQDYEGALKRATAEGKLVLVDISAPWCAQCKELDEKTWPDPAVQAWIARNAVALRLDTDSKRKDLAPVLKIQSYPTVILLDGDGRERARSLGFQKPEAMLKFLGSVRP